MYPWWIERPDLTEEVRSLMNNSDFTVFEDSPHNCFHIIRGYGDEFTSVSGPWGESCREVLRRQGWIMHNNESQKELDYYKEQHEKLQRDGDKLEEDAVKDMVKNITSYGCDGKIYFTPK